MLNNDFKVDNQQPQMFTYGIGYLAKVHGPDSLPLQL
jgi:hypothetical protein